MNHTIPQPVRRRGASLLEVIACTGLVALLMVPMAGVLRASGKSIRQSEGPATANEQLPSNGLALQRYIGDCEAIVKYADDVVVVLRGGEYVEVALSGDTLTARESKAEVVIAQRVRSMTFENEYRSDSGELYGLVAVLESTDAGGEPWTLLLAVDR